MQLYDLRFTDQGALTRAFGRIIDSDRVGSCSVEREAARIRFLAPAEHAKSLVQLIYLDGGLTWCSGHQVEPLSRAVGDATEGVPASRRKPQRRGAHPI